MGGIIAALPLKWRIIAAFGAAFLLASVFAAGAWKGYAFGFDVAKARGDAVLHKERSDRAEEKAAYAQAIATAEREARERYERAEKHAASMEQEFKAAAKRHAVERAALTKRIADVSNQAASTCAGLPLEWVREFVFALTGSAGGTHHAGGVVSSGAGGTVSGSVSGVLYGSALTTPADMLAFARDYGGMCQRYARQVSGWQARHAAEVAARAAQ